MPRKAPPIPEEWVEKRRARREARGVVAAPVEDRPVPESEMKTAHTYKNVSKHDVYGHAPGEEFELDVTDLQHKALVASSVVEEVVASEGAPAEGVAAGDEATVIKAPADQPEVEAAEEISADESHEGEQA
jgi:hypothetical protein